MDKNSGKLQVERYVWELSLVCSQGEAGQGLKNKEYCKKQVTSGKIAGNSTSQHGSQSC